MEELKLVTEAAPIGAVGVVAWMWLAERRGAQDRDRIITEAHARVMEQQMRLDALVTLVRDNTRAVTSLEHSHRHLIRAVRALAANLEAAARREHRHQPFAGHDGRNPPPRDRYDEPHDPERRTG